MENSATTLYDCETIKWYHLVTGHPGAKRLHLTLSAKYYNPRLRAKVDKYRCTDCQNDISWTVKATAYCLNAK